MNAPPWSLQTTLKSLAEGWQAFFHQPADGRICAALRVVFSSLVLLHLAVLYPDLDLWFTEAGVLPREPSRGVVNPYAWTMFDGLPATSLVIHMGFWLAAWHAVALLIGLLPRVNACLLFIWLVSFQVRNNLINDGEDTLMRMICFFLILIPSGHCWSVNRLIQRWWQARRGMNATSEAKQPSYAVPAWGLRLLQMEMAAMLLSTGLLKLSGEAWVNGTALYYVGRLDDHFGRLPVPTWAFDSPWFVALVTWSVLAIELFVPVLIWFRETRLPCLLIVLAFHLANEWTMNLFLFHWLMICGWLAFFTPADFQWFHKPRGQNSGVGLCRS